MQGVRCLEEEEWGGAICGGIDVGCLFGLDDWCLSYGMNNNELARLLC